MLKKRSTNFHLTTEEEKDIFYSLDHISESQYELLKKNEMSHDTDRNRRQDDENFYDFEFKDPPHARQIILESNGIKSSKLCGICEGSNGNSNSNKDSNCTLI